MTETEWKVGQTVIVTNRGERSIGVIERVGKLHFLLRGSSAKFRVRGGHEATSDSWNYRRWVRAARSDDEIQEVKSEAEHRRLVAAVVDRAEWLRRNARELSDERLQSVIDAVGAVK